MSRIAPLMPYITALPFKAILSNSAGEIDRIECATIQRLHLFLAECLTSGHWTPLPGDKIEIIETTEEN